jgi:micrococcal nuclease
MKQPPVTLFVSRGQPKGGAMQFWRAAEQGRLERSVRRILRPLDWVKRRPTILLAFALTASISGQTQPPPPAKPQPRPSAVRTKVDPAAVQVDDGDTVLIRWSAKDVETVRILGIDCPEIRHIEHDIPFDQPFGLEASAFAQGAFGTARDIELLRASTLDPYGRTLGYLFVDGRNYSEAVIDQRLAYESVTPFGDNGFPAEAAKIMAAAAREGPLPFEPPFQYRARMAQVARWMKENGTYPSR